MVSTLFDGARSPCIRREIADSLREADVAELAFDNESTLAQCCEVSAARYKAHVATSLGESRPEIAANTA